MYATVLAINSLIYGMSKRYTPYCIATAAPPFMQKRSSCPFFVSLLSMGYLDFPERLEALDNLENLESLEYLEDLEGLEILDNYDFLTHSILCRRQYL